MTGFNRRFAPHVGLVRERLAGRADPVLVSYRMNAGFVPADSWLHGPEGGGRNIGEACHIYDLFIHLIGAPPVRVDAAPVHVAGGTPDYYQKRDNFTAVLHFADGSQATLLYTAMGAGTLPKERMEVYSGGSVAVLDDFRTLELHGHGVRRHRLRRQDKGHRAELLAFAASISGGSAWPIPLEEQLAATRVSFVVEEALVGR